MPSAPHEQTAPEGAVFVSVTESPCLRKEREAEDFFGLDWS